jgi:putative two-component system response regulator
VLNGLLSDFNRKVAISGEKALQLAFSDPSPDLILLDIMMPGMDGYEVCRQLRENEKTQDIPVIFLTAKSTREDIVKGFEVGGQDYVTKPFGHHELLQRVKTHLELKSQRETLKKMNEVLD